MNIFESKKSNKTKIYIDEVWRWALAWDIMICCVQGQVKCYVNDSKKLSWKKREEIFLALKNEDISYSLGSSTNAYIDKYGLTKATRQAILKWIKKLGYKPWDNILLVIDWKFDYWMKKYFETIMIIWWDGLVPEISAASIIAKVTRDKKMNRLSKKFPWYMREKNVGYGSKAHRQAIKKFWLTKHHRKSFCKNFN